MDRSGYAAMAADEGKHWWFVSRRRVLEALIARRAAPQAGAHVLDMGCGSGGNMEMLGRFGDVEGAEYDAASREIAAERGIGPVFAGGLPDDLDVEDERYGLIGMFDVLEHIDDDVGSLRALGAKLAPDGALVLSVPALPWLWSGHDVAHHHYRRYTAKTLRAAIAEAGLREDRIGYFNSVVFPLALVQRLIQKLTGLGQGAAGIPSPPVNALLRWAFGLERHLIGRVPMPIGLSLFAVIRR